MEYTISVCAAGCLQIYSAGCCSHTALYRKYVVFCPVFGTIAVFLAGSTTQQVCDYLHSSSAQHLGQTALWAGSLVYYLLPNFSAFDLKVNAIYALPINSSGILLTLGYWVIYITVLLGDQRCSSDGGR